MNKQVFYTSRFNAKRCAIFFSFLRVHFLAVVMVCCLYLQANGQSDKGTTLTEVSADSSLTKPRYLRKVMEELGERARGNNIRKFKESRNAIEQSEIIGQIKRITLQAGDFVKTSLDTTTIWREHHSIDSLFDLAGDGIFKKAGTIPTHRNLTISFRIISVLLDKSTQRKTEVDEYRRQLASYKFQLDSLSADSVLYEFPSDSATFTEYLNTLFLTVADIAPADSAIQHSIENIQGLQIQLSLQVNKLNRALETIDATRSMLSSNALMPELVKIWIPIKYTRPLPEIMEFSKEKNQLALNYYAANNSGKIIFVLMVIIGLGIFIRNLKDRLVNENELRKEYAGQLIFRHPLLSGIFIGLNLLQFFFADPPFIFSMLFWILSAFCLTVIFRGYISKFWMSFWITISFLFLLACADNLILQSSRQERWWMAVISVAGVLVGIYFLLRGRKDQLKEKGIIYFIGFVILLEILAMLLNVFGRYNLSKTLFVSGFMSVVVGIEFLWTARLLNEMIIVASRFYGKKEKDLLLSDERTGHKVPALYYLLLFFGWFILFARNYYSFRLLTDPLGRMLVEEHSIGNYSFTVNNILVFIVIIALSTFLSKLVSFFASHQPGVIPDKNSPKSKMGSWILIVRISIICIGLFLAAAAAGIPMDRITLLLGALGVGIGFGLQELTSSLISGIIIAFEKPVNVGDVVEVDSQSGTMKSIGFRSSVITNWDGADVIVPNSTLLSSNLINWTMSNEKRRVDIEIHMEFGTDLAKVKTLLLDVLEADQHVIKFPPPSIEMMELKYNIVNLRIYFWVIHVYEWEATRSDLLQEIDRIFKEHGIKMPVQV
jgi:potassium efflux system protein